MVSVHLSIQGAEMSEKRKVIAISGGFDPVHIGHVQMIEAAAELGDVMVIVNSDDWLLRKKGYVFMPWDEKAYIMSQFKGVVKVVSVDDADGTVCEELGIEMLWNIGGDKIQSSSDLVNKAKWGKMVINGVEI